MKMLSFQEEKDEEELGDGAGDKTRRFPNDFFFSQLKGKRERESEREARISRSLSRTNGFR